MIKVNGKKGDGVALAKQFAVKGYPTFVVIDGEGEVIRSWIGYSKSEAFLGDLSAAVTDPVSIKGRIARFHDSPTENDAVALASYHESRMESVEALEMYQKARELSDDPGKGYEFEIFQSSVYAAKGEKVSLDQVKQNADAVLAAEEIDTESVLLVGLYMTKVARQSDQADLANPYIEAGVQAADRAGSLSEEAEKMAGSLRISYALKIDGDVEKAMELKRASLKPGWDEDPDELNSFAWWCFENNTNLEQAETLAAKGVELAAKDAQKANILDTLAEIRFLKGDKDGAMSAIAEAIELDPENEYFKKQTVKFSGASM